MRITPAVDPKRWSAGREPESRLDHFRRIRGQVVGMASLDKLILRLSLNLYADERATRPIGEVARTLREGEGR